METKKLLEIAGVYTLAFIEQNIKAGIDYEGNKFKYSDKPFYRPHNKNIENKLGGKDGNGKLYNIVKSKNTGKLGMIILGGYKEYKKFIYPDSYNNFLTATGKMLRSMSVLKINDNEAIIGFTGQENIDKAYFLNVSGAGRSRKLWKFLGITEKQKQELIDKLEVEVYKIAVSEFMKIKT